MRTLTVEPVIRKIQVIWPLFPAALYLLGFLFVVTTYLLGLSFSCRTPDSVIFPTVRSFHVVLSMPEFREALVNTVIFVVLGTPIELIVGLFTGLLIYRTFRGRELVRSIFLIPLAIPALVTATLLFILFDFPGGHVNHILTGKYVFFPQLLDVSVNWRSNKLFALGISLLGKVWRDMPISMLIILAGLNTIDPELFDAAKTMGAGPWRRIRLIVFPLIVPAMAAVVLLRSLEMWKEFIFPFILAGKYPLLGTLIESLYNNWGKSHEASSVAVVLVVCIIISTLLLTWLLDLLRKRLNA